MEYNVGAVLVAHILLLTAFIAVLVAIYASIVKKRTNHQYEKVATKIIPENLNTFFGYNGRLFSIESFDHYEKNGKLSDIVVKVDAFKILDNKLYLNSNFQCQPRGGYYEMTKLYDRMLLSANLPENRGKYVLYNKLGRSYRKPAAFRLNSSDKHQYYLLTL
jgi:hypothetical protein